MSVDFTATITGIQEALAANLRAIAAAKPEGALGQAVMIATTDLHRYAEYITHVQTGTLRSAHRIGVLGAARSEIYIDPSAVNPRTHERAADYGPTEEARGGDHAFYERTYKERGDVAAGRALDYLAGRLS